MDGFAYVQEREHGERLNGELRLEILSYCFSSVDLFELNRLNLPLVGTQACYASSASERVIESIHD